MLQQLGLAKQYCADSQVAAERGRLVREIRRAHQHRAGDLRTIAAARDLGRRLWDRKFVRRPRRDLGVA